MPRAVGSRGARILEKQSPPLLFPVPLPEEWEVLALVGSWDGVLPPLPPPKDPGGATKKQRKTLATVCS